jgi:hypothetical protein
LHQLANGAPRRRRGVAPGGQGAIRHGAQLYAEQGAADAIGVVTSGGFGPSVNAPIAMGYLTRPGAPAGGTFYAICGERACRCGCPSFPSFPRPTNADAEGGRSNMLKFTQDHEWLLVEGDTATIGITQHAQEQLGDLVFVELPKPWTIG